MLVEFKMFFFNWGHLFFKLGAMGANGLVEFENVFLIGDIFYNLGHIFKVGGK